MMLSEVKTNKFRSELRSISCREWKQISEVKTTTYENGYSKTRLNFLTISALFSIVKYFDLSEH